jgi:hypothetical protein
MIIYSIYKKNQPVTPRQVINVIDLGYLGVEKDFPEQLSSHCHIKRRKTKNCPKKKKSITKFILTKEDIDRAYYLQIEKVQDNE